MDEAAKPGLSVEECVRRLKRYHYAFKRLHQIFTARITAEPIYELKMGFSLHAHLCAEHVAALRKRVGEMREPPLGLEAVPDPNLEIFFDEILGAPTTEELLARALREGRSRAESRARTASAGHQPAGRPSDRPRLPLRLAGSGRHAGVRRAKRRRAGGCRPARQRLSRLALVAGRLSCRAPAGWTASRHPAAKPAPAPVFRQALPIRPRSQTGRALPRSLQHGRERRSVSLRRAVPARAQDADDVLQAAARDRRARNDGQHHHRNAAANRGSTTAT